MRIKTLSILRSLISFVVLLSAFGAFGDYESPTTTTNLNEETNFFETQIDDKKGLEKKIHTHKHLYGVEQNGTSGLDGVVNLSEAEASGEVQNLKAIDASNLETEGNRKYATEEGAELMNMHVDLSDPLLQAEKRDLEKIADDTAKGLGDLMTSLRNIGIDCNEDGSGSIAEPIFTTTKTRTTHSDTNFDKALCEELKNTYNCKKSLNVKCKQKNLKAFELASFTSDLPRQYNGDTGFLTIGWNWNHTKHGGSGTKHNHYIHFNIEDVESVSEFRLYQINWDDHIRVTVNGTQVFIGPYPGDRLELVKRHWATVVQIDSSALRHSPELSQWFVRTPNVDIRKHLKNGLNKIEVTLIVGGMGGLWLNFIAKASSCGGWEENWEERCVHKQ